MALYDVPAPAKVNLFLHVVGRRADGYHLLQSVFRFVDLCDRLNFEVRSDGKVRCDSSPSGVAHDDDLVVRAARALQRATGCGQGVQIQYDKAIPAGGGLGGGSSDAATTLIALNRLWNTGLDRRQLMQLALPLGADVPVFIFGQPAFAEGVGELLSAVEVPEKAYLIVQPRQDVPTAGIFSSPDLTRDSETIKMSIFADWQAVEAKKNGSSNASFFGRNDLQSVACAKYPAVDSLAKLLLASGINARMSGSGGCFFAEFATLKQAQLVQQKITAKMLYPSGGNSSSEGVVRNAWACPGLKDHPLRHWIHD